MYLVSVLVVTAALALAAAQETTANDANDAINTNTVETSKPSVRLDPYIRKALLKALSELEENDDTTGPDSIDGTSTADTEILQTGDDVTVSPTKENIQIHSYIVNGQSVFTNSTNATPTFFDNKISIISSTAGNVENQVTAALPTQPPHNDIFQTSQSSVNVRSVAGSSSTRDNSISSSSKPTTPRITTTTTTTTTTPKPTHNDDGENIEEVSKQDVQVFQAPLVAAFTVQQDSQGLPKKVIPIFQQMNLQPVGKPVPPTSLPAVVSSVTPFQNLNAAAPSDFVNQQLALQRQLEEKQRVLEEQLRVLLIQQRQQEELLRKQQFLLQQKEQQRQQQLLFEQDQLRRQQQIADQQRLQGQANVPFQRLPQTTQQNQNGAIRPQGPVTIQPSVAFEQSQSVSLTNQQQLPSREAVDFLIHLRNQQPDQFPLQENHIPQGISNFLQPQPQNFNQQPQNFNQQPQNFNQQSQNFNQVQPQNFNQGNNFNQLRPEDQFRQKQHGNRVFRQEAGVGNFGFNNPVNRFNPAFGSFFPNQLSNRHSQFNPDTELKQLFLQNGLNGKSQEDLNIVSKVLALNHGVPFNQQVSNNRLSFDQRRHVRQF